MNFFPFFHDPVGALTQLSRLVIQLINAVSAALTEQIMALLAGEYRGHKPAYGSQA